MNPMEHDAARDRLGAYADGEVEVDERVALEEHLATCEICQGELDIQQRLSQRIADDVERYRAPPAFARAMAAELHRAAPSRRAFAWHAWRWRDWVGPIVSSAALAASLTLFLRVPGAADQIDDEVVGAHLRALISGDVVDVASSDRHTVKPWFAGKIDYSPPVTDFAASGYELIGGRLDYIDHRPAAALVYRHAAHRISVFVLPADASNSPARGHTSEQRGYRILSWT